MGPFSACIRPQVCTGLNFLARGEKFPWPGGREAPAHRPCGVLATSCGFLPPPPRGCSTLQAVNVPTCSSWEKRGERRCPEQHINYPPKVLSPNMVTFRGTGDWDCNTEIWRGHNSDHNKYCKNKNKTSVGKDVKKLESLPIIDGNVK